VHNSYTNPEYTPGGNALKYYSSIRVDVRRGDWIIDEKDKKVKLGQVVKFRVVKNKTDVPHKEGYFKFLYTGELDRIDELVSLGLLKEVISRKGAYYNLVGKTFLGREEMEKALKTDTELFEKARKEIFEVHVHKRKRPIQGYDLDSLAAASEGYVGAEIEQAVIDAMYIAFNDRQSPGRDFTTGDVLRALSKQVPMSRSQREAIAALRQWLSEGRAQSASFQEVREAELQFVQLQIEPSLN